MSTLSRRTFWIQVRHCGGYRCVFCSSLGKVPATVDFLNVPVGHGFLFLCYGRNPELTRTTRRTTRIRGSNSSSLIRLAFLVEVSLILDIRSGLLLPLPVTKDDCLFGCVGEKDLLFVIYFWYYEWESF